MKHPIKLGGIVDGRKILAIADLPHQDDAYLKVVLCKYRDLYVSWLYNGDFGTFNHGRYCEDLRAGREAYAEHCLHYKAEVPVIFDQSRNEGGSYTIWAYKDGITHWMDADCALSPAEMMHFWQNRFFVHA